jgi:hypothetical protein
MLNNNSQVINILLLLLLIIFKYLHVINYNDNNIIIFWG